MFCSVVYAYVNHLFCNFHHNVFIFLPYHTAKLVITIKRVKANGNNLVLFAHEFLPQKAFAYGKSGFPYKKLLTLRFGNGSFIRLIGKRVQIPCSPAAVSPVISPVYSFLENATVWIKQAKREGKTDAGTSRKTCRHSI